MDQDFLVFQLKLLSSLTPNASLDDNLRVVMAPALAKVMNACGAAVAVHVFVNPEIHELHAMIVGRSDETRAALAREMEWRHHSRDAGRAAVDEHLPSYVRFDWTSVSETQRIFHRDADGEYARALATGDRMLRLLSRLAEERPGEFAQEKPQIGDMVITIPIGAKPYSRLGYVVLWSPRNALARCATDAAMVEKRVGFRTGLEDLLVRVFTNFYQMAPHTYLPSFCRPATKPVTLLCAEIWKFGGLVSVLNSRHELTREEQIACLRSLVSRFTTTAAEVVESHRGRVDQIWGSGLLAVFGEYLDTPEFSARPGCKRALTAARQIVTRFHTELGEWLDKEFRLQAYRQLHAEEVKIASVVAIDHGEVVLDYVGSHRHRVYMTVGDHVMLVKELAAMAGTGGLGAAESDTAQRLVRLALEPGTLDGPPIVLTQSARELAADILRDRPGRQVGEVSIGRVVRTGGFERDCVVYPIYPENIREMTDGS